MKYDINTLDDLIKALDGPTKAALQTDISPSGVCNWRYKGYLPPSRHLDVVILLKKLGKTVNPSIFDRTEEDWRVLGFSPETACEASA